MYNFIHIKDRTITLNEFKPSGRPVLVMLRGLSRSYRGWLGLQEDLSEKYDVICMDLPGVGLSKGEALLYSIEDMAAKMVEVINYLKIPNFFIMAPSLGSIVTYEIVRKVPLSRILGLILLVPSHTGFGINRLSKRAIKTLSTSSFVSPETKMKMLQEMLIGKAADGSDIFSSDTELSDRWKKQLLEDTVELGPKGQLSQLFAAGKYTSKKGLDYIKKYHIPTKFIIAKGDMMIPLAHKKKIFEYVRHPNCDLIELEHCGHDFVVTHKKEIEEIVINFIDNIDKYERKVGDSDFNEPRKYPKVVNKIAVGAGLLALGAIAAYLLKNRKR